MVIVNIYMCAPTYAASRDEKNIFFGTSASSLNSAFRRMLCDA